jgi:cytochrome P450
LSSNGIPGPRGWPLLGILPEMRRDVLGVMSAACRFGDLVELKNPLFRLYLLNHPDYVAYALQGYAARFGRSPFYAVLKPVLGDGLLTSDGDFWRRQRQTIQPAFLTARLQDYAPIITNAVARLCVRWEDLARRGEIVDVGAEMNNLAVEMIGDILFGDSIGATPDLRGDIQAIQENVSSRYWSMLPPAVADFLPTPANFRYQKARRRLDNLIYDLIEQHRQSPRPGAILSLLLKFRDPETGGGMDSRQVRDEVMTLFLAGHETTASALTWLWLLLAQNREAELQVQAEADAVGGVPSAGALNEPSFTKRTIQETLRLFPPIWTFSRQALADTEFNGQMISEGSVVVVCAYTLHRHPEFWPDPNIFDPDRFLPERMSGRPRFAYVPFGGGPRICLGGQLATMEMLSAVAGIASRFELRLASNAPVAPEALVTLRPKGGLKMMLRPRMERQSQSGRAVFSGV